MWASGFNTPDLPELGEKALDDEHRTIATFLHDLHAAITAGKPVADQRLLLYEALSFLRVNCSHEEQLMQSENFPHYAMHCKAHERLYARMLWLDEALTRSTPSGALEALETLSSDLFQHMDKEDRRIVSWHREFVANSSK